MASHQDRDEVLEAMMGGTEGTGAARTERHQIERTAWPRVVRRERGPVRSPLASPSDRAAAAGSERRRRRGAGDPLGFHCVGQRSQVHKLRNVLARLLESLHVLVGKALPDAWDLFGDDRQRTVRQRQVGQSVA